jgi:hypothetical protein
MPLLMVLTGVPGNIRLTDQQLDFLQIEKPKIFLYLIDKMLDARPRGLLGSSHEEQLRKKVGPAKVRREVLL